jgi:hypothetical protein
MKVNEEVLKQLQARRNALASVQTLVQMANREYNLYLQHQVKEAGTDMSKKWVVDEKTGEITEQKEEVNPEKK